MKETLDGSGYCARAAAARSFRGELILTYGNEAGTAWIANLVFSLRRAGIEHFLVIVMSDEHCRALSRPPWMISCAWSSWDFGGCKNKGELRRLWYSRHHYMSPRHVLTTTCTHHYMYSPLHVLTTTGTRATTTCRA